MLTGRIILVVILTSLKCCVPILVWAVTVFFVLEMMLGLIIQQLVVPYIEDDAAPYQARRTRDILELGGRCMQIATATNRRLPLASLACLTHTRTPASPPLSPSRSHWHARSLPRVCASKRAACVHTCSQIDPQGKATANPARHIKR